MAVEAVEAVEARAAVTVAGEMAVEAEVALADVRVEAGAAATLYARSVQHQPCGQHVRGREETRPSQARR